MNEQKPAGGNTSIASPAKDPLIPINPMIIDGNGDIHFVASEINFLSEKKSCGMLGSNISQFFENLVSPTDFQDLKVCTTHTKIDFFSRTYQSIASPARLLCITGYLSPFPDLKDGWLLIIQDITICGEMLGKIASLENDIETLKQTENRELDEATASLIETNVALRKEIRDRQDVLERLSDSEARFRNLTETTSDFIWELNNAGNYTYASPKSTKLLGLEPHELLGTPLFLLRKVESASEFIKHIEFVGKPKHGFSKMEYSHTRHDGSEVIVESSGEPIFSKLNKFIGFRGIDRDITERHLYEIQLKQAKEAAESANLAKSDFLANMSHELRTPLHAILSFAKYGEKRIESVDRKDLLRFFNQITISAQRLLPLIDSLLDLAKLESGKMVYDFQDRDLVMEFRSAIHEISPLAEKKEIQIQIAPRSVATTAFFDQPTIAQVIRNLLANGVKFSTPQTTITISFNILEDTNKNPFLKTTISNYGVEIPANELDAVFDKFTQSSKTKTGAGGSGLGLSICKQIVEDHGGTIWASQGADGDTRFHFTLQIQ